MKKLHTLTLATVLLTTPLFAMADADDITIDVIDSDIMQSQEGNGNIQDLKIGVIGIADHIDAKNISLNVATTKTTQTQSGSNNQQKASIGVVGCDC